MPTSWYSDLMTKDHQPSPRASLLVIGDVLVYVLATLSGFATHNGLVFAAWERILATLGSFILAWFLISPWIVGAGTSHTGSLARWWRPALAAIYAAPLGAWFRGLWIGAPIQLVFVAVMMVVTAGLMVVWRGGIWPLASHPG